MPNIDSAAPLTSVIAPSASNDDDRVHRRADDLAEARLGLQQLAHVTQLELLSLDLANALLLLGDSALLEAQLDEHLHLRAEDGRLERLGDVVDRADGVALEDVFVVLADRREEDDRNELAALARLDQLRRLEAVHAGHLHVEQNHREVALEQAAQRVLARRRAHEALPERLENRLEREQVLRAVVDEKDVDRVGGERRGRHCALARPRRRQAATPSVDAISGIVSTRARGTHRESPPTASSDSPPSPALARTPDRRGRRCASVRARRRRSLR